MNCECDHGAHRVARLHESYASQIRAAFEAEANALERLETAERNLQWAKADVATAERQTLEVVANLAAAIEARADELTDTRPACGHPLLVDNAAYVSGLRAAAEIVRAQINP